MAEHSKAPWYVGSTGNCIWCSEAGRCECKHTTPSEQSLRRAAESIMEGLLTDGAHHKQFYLEDAARFLGADVEYMRRIHGYKTGVPG